MTKRSGQPTPDNEVPLVVPTPDGPAVVSVVSVAVGSMSGSNVDRLILRSAIDGRPDAFAVFERHHGDRAWRKVTPDLSLAELEHWTELRRLGVWPGQPFQH